MSQCRFSVQASECHKHVVRHICADSGDGKAGPEACVNLEESDLDLVPAQQDMSVPGSVEGGRKWQDGIQRKGHF